MSFNIKTRFSKINFALLTIVCGSLSFLSYSSLAAATTFKGPTELDSKEFKDLVVQGPAKLNGVKADSLVVAGPLNFNDLKVKGKTEISGPGSGEGGEFANVTVHGPFESSKVKMGSLQVDGPVTLEDFKITGDVNINGPLKAKNGSFKNINTVYAPIALYSVTVNNINVNKDRNKGRDDDNDNGGSINEIKLAGNTVVSGDIIFESGDGIVYIRDKTAQLKGKVIGGKVKQNDTESPPK